MKRILHCKIFSKTLCALLLVLFSFHFSGVETAFCQDDKPSAPVSSSSKAANTHGCMNCQPGHHLAAEIPSASIPAPEPNVFSVEQDTNFLVQTPLSHPFRPPISA
jgi:hypothetical protein